MQTAAYRRNFKRMRETWKHYILGKRGFIKVPPFYNLLYKMEKNLSNFSTVGEVSTARGSDDSRLLSKFYQKYPSAFSNWTYGTLSRDAPTYFSSSPADEFVRRQKGFIRKGYNEHKAFQLVEDQMAAELEAERQDRSTIEGFATSNRARSLMSVYEQKSEYEARLKVQRVEREIPSYLRANSEAEVEKVFQEYEPATCVLLIRLY